MPPDAMRVDEDGPFVGYETAVAVPWYVDTR